MHERHSHVYAIVQCVRNTRRYVVIYTLRRNLTLVPSFRPSPSLSLSPLARQNFSLMSNSRIDDFNIVPPLPLSLFLFFLCLLFTAHTIIAFVPLRSLVVLNFHISEEKKIGGKKRKTYTYRFLVTAQTWYRCYCSTKKRLSQKRACACLPARN